MGSASYVKNPIMRPGSSRKFQFQTANCVAKHRGETFDEIHFASAKTENAQKSSHSPPKKSSPPAALGFLASAAALALAAKQSKTKRGRIGQDQCLVTSLPRISLEDTRHQGTFPEPRATKSRKHAPPAQHTRFYDPEERKSYTFGLERDWPL
jgi:hypothetical protein